jgi:hypothetical protein
VLQASFEADTAQKVERTRAPLGCTPSRHPHRHLGIFNGAELWKQMMKLKHEPDVTIAECDQFTI